MLVSAQELPLVHNILELKTKISNRKQELSSMRLARQRGENIPRLNEYHDFGIKQTKRELRPLMQFYRLYVRARKRAA